MKEIKVTFKTITPLWIGDAWGDCKEIKPSAIMGSLRFWFETIMYFKDILENEDFNSKSGRFEKEVDRKKLKDFVQKYGNDKMEIIKYLINKQHIPISSVIFGATNWRSLIEIKKIEFDENRFQDEPKGKIIPNKKWYFGSPSYQGEFAIIFKVKEEILNSIFYPLLTFMDKYGFWGGKWNIGYGRLKIESIEENNIVKNSWQKSDFELFDDICFSWDELYVANDFNELLNAEKKIKFLEYFVSENSYKQSVIELIKLKMQKRAKYREDSEYRHKVFGSTKSPPKKDLLPQGSKVLPFIFEENNQLKGGFLSIAGLLNLEGESNE